MADLHEHSRVLVARDNGQQAYAFLARRVEVRKTLFGGTSLHVPETALLHVSNFFRGASAIQMRPEGNTSIIDYRGQHAERIISPVVITHGRWPWQRITVQKLRK